MKMEITVTEVVELINQIRLEPFYCVAWITKAKVDHTPETLCR